MDVQHQHDHHAPPIDAVNLSASFGGSLAVEAVTFRVETGQRIAVVGPNGAGKTTLFKLIAGIIRPASGSLDIFGHGPGKHVCVGYLPQRAQANLEFPVTVSQVVMMGRIREIGLLRWPRKADWARVDSALERVGLLDQRSEHIGELSAGLQQRAFMAQAVAQQASIVLLDEPMSGLDLPSQEGILEILDDLQREQITVLVATHDLNLASEHFDRVMLLNRRLIAYGEPATTITTEALGAAYGGHIHTLPDGKLIVDSHYEGGRD